MLIPTREGKGTITEQGRLPPFEPPYQSTYQSTYLAVPLGYIEEIRMLYNYAGPLFCYWDTSVAWPWAV